jgi:hypothetical protein
MVHIQDSTDINAIDILRVSIFSLLKNKKDTTYYEITILSKGFLNKHIDDLNAISIRFSNNTLRVIDCTDIEKKYGIDKIFKPNKDMLNIA